MKQTAALQAKPPFRPATPELGGTVKAIAADHLNQAVFWVTAGLVGIGYSLLLPFEYTQRLAWANWHYLNGRLIAYSVAFAIGVAWIVTVQFHATRQVLRRRGGSAGAVGAVLGVVPSLLCCTPVIPTALGAVGLSGVSLAHTSGRIQSFFAVNQNAILASSLGLVVAAGVWATHRAAHADCLSGDGCPADTARADLSDPETHTRPLAARREPLTSTDPARSHR